MNIADWLQCNKPIIPVSLQDRNKMLEDLAAAIGQQVQFNAEGEPFKDGVAWNPWDNDSDAFRIAVQLDILGSESLSKLISTRFYEDPCKLAVARHCIVYLISEIGQRYTSQKSKAE